MQNEETKEEIKNDNGDSDNPNQDNASWSKVSTKKSDWFLDKKIWIVGCVCFFIIFMMIFSGGNKKSIQKNNPAINQQSDNTELNQNLAKLESLSSQIKNDQNKMSESVGDSDEQDDSSLFLNRKQKKEIIARQNAPTSMFSESVNNVNVGSQNKSPSTVSADSQNSATFAGQGVDTAFGNQSMTTTSVTAQKIAHPDDTIASGEFLHAVLETAINSDLPGEIRAVVSQPVYAYIGETPLIPAGSRLIGQYSSSVTQGQDRVFVVWNRVILPNGVSAEINSPGTDQLGIAGQGADGVNTHFFARFGEASLLSIIGAGAASGGVSTSDQYNSAAQYRTAIAQSFQQSANNSLQNTLPTKPTISINQGALINVFVAHDIDFYSVMKVNS